MYCNHVFLTFFICALYGNINAQTPLLFSESDFIRPYKLEVTFNKTTNLIFPVAVKSVDRGSDDIIIQKANGTENVLRIKADIKSFPETNLSVITGDGRLYSFIVNYTEFPEYLNINLGKGQDDTSFSPRILQQPVSGDENLMKHSASKALTAMSNIIKQGKKESKVTLLLTGLYLINHTLFCRLQIKNESNINYKIDHLGLYLKEKKETKNSLSHEEEVKPWFQLNKDIVKENSMENLVLSLPITSIEKSKNLIFEIHEFQGSRHLSLKLKNRHLLQASVL